MKKIFLMIILGMLLIATTLAINTLGTFKQEDSIRIAQVCSDASFITISSITYPNSSIAFANTNMTFAGSGEFYIDFNNTQQLGRYDVRGISDGCENTFATYFEVTPNGLNLTTSSVIANGFVLILFFGLAIFFLLYAKNTEVDGVKLFFNIISYIMIIVAVGGAYILLQTTQSGLLGLSKGMIFVIATVFIVIMFYIFINLTRTSLALMRAKKGFGSELDNPPTF